MAKRKKSAKKAALNEAVKTQNREVEGIDRLLAFLAYFLGIVGIVIAVVAGSKKPFVKYHAGQALALFVFEIIVLVVGFLTLLLLVGMVIWLLGGLLAFIIWIMGIVYSLSGTKEPLPIIGGFGEKIMK